MKFGTYLWVRSKKEGIQYKKKLKQYLIVENTSYQSSPHLLHKKKNQSFETAQVFLFKIASLDNCWKLYL